MLRLWFRKLILVAILVHLSATVVFSIGLPENWEKAVLIIEYKRPPGQPCSPKLKFDTADEEKTASEFCAAGTGFMMHICGSELLFSNKHILSASSKIPLSVRMKNNAGEFRRIEIKSWRGHPNPGVDIAAAMIPIPPEYAIEDFTQNQTAFGEDSDRKLKEPTSFLVKLKDLRVGDDVLLVGYPSYIPGVMEILQSNAAPIFRAGIVSARLPGVTRLTLDARATDVKDTFLIDAWAFKGNSGSPVFLKPISIRYGGDRPHLRLNRPYIVGIQGAILGNTGLAIVYASDGIEETAAQFPGAQCPPPLPPITEKK